MNLAQFRELTASLPDETEIHFKDLNFPGTFCSFETEHFSIVDGQLVIEAPHQEPYED